MTVLELKAALDAMGVEYPRKARKAKLEALHVATLARKIQAQMPVSTAQPYVPATAADAELYWPKWAEKRRRLPPSMKRSHVLRRGKPPGNPPGGGKWVTGDKPPAWLMETE